MADAGRFAKYKMIKADPPPEVMLRATDASPMQEAVRKSYDEGAWQSFQGVPAVPTIEFPASPKRAARTLSESDILQQELRRAARQLGYSISLRTCPIDGKPGLEHVFFRASAKKRGTPDPAGEVQPELQQGTEPATG